MNTKIRHRLARLLPALLLLPAFTAVAPATYAQPTPTASTPALIVGGIGNQMNPGLIGDMLVFDDCPLPSRPCSVSAYNFATQDRYQIAGQAAYIDGQNATQRTDGVTAVWSSNDFQTTYATNVTDNSAAPLSVAPGNKRDFAVWGDIIVWTDGRNSPPDAPINNDIYMYDRATGQERAIATHQFDSSHPVTNGSVIVWQDNRNAGFNGFNADLYGYDIANGLEFVIADSAEFEGNPVISGNTVIWVSQQQTNPVSIQGYDLETGEYFTVAESGASISDPNSFVGLTNPAIWGNIVVWIRNEYPQGPGYALRSGVYGYDLTTLQQFTIVDDANAIRSTPAVSGNRVVWVEFSKTAFSDGRRDIMASTLSGVTVDPVETPPVPAAPTSRTFPETGKTVEGRFLDYWMKHGGLPQQGYPISDVMQETSALDGKIYTVQYFERAVFEMHPENQPPYDVLLSQLGTFRFQELYPEPQRPNPTEGMIKGRLSYPSEVIPSLSIYAIPVDGAGPYHSVRTWFNSLEYTIEGVTPGTYYVVAYMSDQPDSLLNMAYTEAAKCQQAEPTSPNCNDHTLIPVTVGARETVEGISPTDYSNEIQFPTRPAGTPEEGMCQTFQETGKLVCGDFLMYWYEHGGLAQQGYPISTPMTEVSALDGNEYTVQYFERAVFEEHPELEPPFDVLLSQLGTFRYRDLYTP